MIFREMYIDKVTGYRSGITGVRMTRDLNVPLSITEDIVGVTGFIHIKYLKIVDKKYFGQISMISMTNSVANTVSDMMKIPNNFSFDRPPWKLTMVAHLETTEVIEGGRLVNLKVNV